MTRAERVIRIAERLVAYAEEFQTMPYAHISSLQAALALPPDPVPRRLTLDDMMALYVVEREVPLLFNEKAAWLNARIFGGER